MPPVWESRDNDNSLRVYKCIKHLYIRRQGEKKKKKKTRGRCTVGPLLASLKIRADDKMSRGFSRVRAE